MKWNRLSELLDAYITSPLDYFRRLLLATLAALVSTLPPIVQTRVGYLCSGILCWGVIAYLSSVMFVLVCLVFYHLIRSLWE
jgi:hypothetical protein